MKEPSTITLDLFIIDDNEIDMEFVQDVLEADSTGTGLLAPFTSHVITTFFTNYKNCVLNKDYFNFFSVVDGFSGLNHDRLQQDKNPLLEPLWVIFLRVQLRFLPKELMFHYPSVDAFQSEYKGILDATAEELELLYLTANWMHIFTRMVPAKKSKGLAMKVIPKLLEGYSAKYILGSGQTRATSQRVAIFEHEGNVKPNKKPKRNSRGGRKAAKGARTAGHAAPPAPSSADSSSEQSSVCRSRADSTASWNSLVDNDSDPFGALRSMHTLHDISTHIYLNEEMSAEQKWAWMLQTELLPSCSPARRAFLETLNAQVCQGVLSLLAAVEEMAALDARAVGVPFNTHPADVQPETLEALSFLEELFAHDMEGGCCDLDDPLSLELTMMLLF